MRLKIRILILGIFITGMLAITSHEYSMAQFIPLPPPTNDLPSQINGKPMVRDDQNPPTIQVVTNSLHDGKNVFKVRIDDESGVASAFLKYVHDGQVKTEQLLNQGGDLYGAIIDIRQPSKIVELQASDPRGNVKNTYVEFSLVPANDLIRTLTDMFGRVLNLLSNGK